MNKGWTIQNWTTGELNALVKNLGGEEMARKVQRGEVRVNFKEALKVLFNKHGRRIPEGLSASVCDADRNFQLNQPKLDKEVDFADRILRLHECLSIDTGVTAEQFKAETERLLALIQNNSRISNIVNGVWLPVVLPQLTIDIGTALEQYLEAVDESYAKTFDNRKLYNYRKDGLINKVSIVDESRHDQLVERMKQGSVIGIHFPNSLQGFSINASREQMQTLPEGFVLSGIDTPIAMAMYPDILARNWNTPGLDLAALSWRSADHSLCFEASDDFLGFVLTGGLADAYDFCSGGLLFLG